jgi:hypothetical protein
MLKVTDDHSNRSAMQDNLAIDGLTDDVFWTLLERSNQSGAELDPYRVHWTFWVDGQTVDGGAGCRALSAVGKNGTLDATWESYEHEDEQVACAAVALFAHLMLTAVTGFNKLKNTYRSGAGRALFAKKAAELQEALGWDAFVTIADLGKFVEHDPFKDMRIVLLMPFVRSSMNQSFEGVDFAFDPDRLDRTVYLYLDPSEPNEQHYVLVRNVKTFISACHGASGTRYDWCDQCLCWWNRETRIDHVCDDGGGNELPFNKRGRFVKNKECADCGEEHHPDRKHKCGKTYCASCHLFIQRGNAWHRCPFYDNRFDQLPPPFVSDAAEVRDGGKRYCVWVYDLESCLVPVPDGPMDRTVVQDGQGQFCVDEQGEYLQTYTVRRLQVPNLVCFRNVFVPDSEVVVMRDLKDFIRFMLNHNGGRNICLAHNASGYDSRLVFSTLVEMAAADIRTIKPILRGTKFMRMEVGHTVFVDTMLHLRGRLKDLAAQFFPGHEDLHKGNFPHLFNTQENQCYRGPLPGKEYFDLAYTCKNQQELDAFNAWHDGYTGVWDFQQEIVAYCKQDVEILARVVKEYHDVCIDKLGEFDPCLQVSPWLSTTSASYVHKLFKRYNSKMLELDVEDVESVANAALTSWCVLEPEEYYFDRLALRGGRTDIRTFHHKVTDADWEAGERIRYVDVVSMYPFVQVAGTYPVGPPTIRVYDSDLYPCYKHFNQLACGCPLAFRRGGLSKKLTVVEEDSQPSVPFLRGFFGIVCCDVTPPDHLFHPVLVHFDNKKHKCVASLEPAEKGVFTSVELQRAMDLGYVVGKVYRIHEYRSGPSRWRGLMEELFKLKLYNSKPPKPELVPDLERGYRESFGMDVDLSLCRERPAVKVTFKTLFTSAWGKHAETVDHIQATVLDENDSEGMSSFMQTLANATNRISSFDGFDQHTLFRYTSNRHKCRPNLHNGYLPAAIFVPAHGRMLLFEQMHPLAERVLMHDTDSIVYLEKPGAYSVPQGSVWGEWEEEDFGPKHNGIREFVAIGPKSYAMRAGDGKEVLKCKGVSIKLGHQRLVNFDTYLSILNEGETVAVPQFTFLYNLRTMRTHHYVKNICFQESMLKGVYDPETTRLYPYGHKKVAEIEAVK